MPSDTQLVVTSSTVKSASDRKKGMDEMCMNILMEAEEKCEEIDVKCEEEYRYLKWKEIIEQRGKVKQILEKRRAEVNKEFRVFMTKLTNNSRLQQLKAKNDVVNHIMEEAKDRLSKGKGKDYINLLKNSMVQALFSMMETQVKVICKKDEKDLVASCFKDVARIYEEMTLLHVKICVAKETLPDKNIGGVIVCNMTDEVSVDCQLDSRVDQVCRLAMPVIVELLFADIKVTEAKPSLMQSKTTMKTESLITFVNEERKLERFEHSPLPQREQGPLSSQIALPVRSSSTLSHSTSPPGYASDSRASQDTTPSPSLDKDHRKRK